MTGLWITLGIFLFFFFIFIIPIHVTVGLTESVSVMIRVLFLKIPILPRPPKKKKKKKKEKKPKKKKKKEKKPKNEEKKQKKEKKEKKKIKASTIVGLVRMLLNVVAALFKRLGRNFKIRVYAYEICVASEEAAKTAVMYGAVKSLSETIFLRLQESINFKIVKKAPVGIYVDFLEEKFKANVKIDFSISIAGVFGILFAAIGELIRSLIKMLFKKNKNG
jgi:cation transport ATPase